MTGVNSLPSHGASVLGFGVNSLPSHGASVLGFGVRNLKYLSTTFHYLIFATVTTTTTIATTSSIPYSSPQPHLTVVTHFLTPCVRDGVYLF